MKAEKVRKASQFAGLAIVASVLFAGCATVRPTSENVDKEASAPKSVTEVIQTNTPKPSMTQYNELIVQGVKLKNTSFDYPITVNSRVNYWVDYFTGRGRKHFVKYLERSEYFIPYIVPLLKQNNMPEDLVYLAMIESGFNNFARSHAKAVGPWQFISATGKRYGLMVNWWVDERRDIRKSTLAAVEYLKDLYAMFGSWELAAAAYNAGEAKIGRAIQRYGTKDFWTITRQKFLRPETRDYVPKIIAAALVAKNRELFGFEPSRHEKHNDEVVAGDGTVVKVIQTDKPEEQLAAGETAESIAQKELRAAIANGDLPDSDDEDEAVAEGLKTTPGTLLVKEVSDSTTSGPLAKPVPTPHLTKDGQVGGQDLVEFDVRSPADLLKVARAAGLSYQTVKSLNPELLRWCTPPTLASFRLKLPATLKDKFLETYNHQAFPRQVQFMTYKVRKGETLQHVARHFGINVDPISDLNGVSSKRPLRSGIQVLLPIPNDRSRSLAALDLRDPPSKRRVKSRSRRYRITSKQRRESAATTKSYRRPLKDT